MTTVTVQIVAHFVKESLTMYHLLSESTQLGFLQDFRDCLQNTEGEEDLGDLQFQTELELDPVTGLIAMSDVLGVARSAVETFNSNGHRITLSLPEFPICCDRWEVRNGKWVKRINYCVEATLAEGCTLPEGMEVMVTTEYETVVA